jgi:hypothetical protein
MLGHKNTLRHNILYLVLGLLNALVFSHHTIVLGLKFYVVTGTVGIVDYTNFDDMKYAVSSFDILPCIFVALTS